MWTPGTVWGAYGDEKVTSQTQDTGNPLGTRMVLPDGRVYYYAQVNGAIGAGKICQMAVPTAQHDMDLAVATAAAVGDLLVNCTLEAALTALDQYKDGYLYVNDEDGEGHVYKIAGHAAIASAGTGDIRLREPIAKALTTSSLVGLVLNPFAEVIIYPVTSTNGVAGVCPADFADNDYGWLQTWGPAAVWCDVAFTVGQPVRVSDGTAGKGEPYASNTSGEEAVIGRFMQTVPAADDYGMVDLQIRP
jgi:hypothetical protein